MDYQSNYPESEKNQSGRPWIGICWTGIVQVYSLTRIEETSSIRKNAFLSELRDPTVHRILRKDLSTRPYKVQTSQQ